MKIQWYKITIAGLLAFMTILISIYAGNIIHAQKISKDNKQPGGVTDTLGQQDMVETEGTPTNEDAWNEIDKLAKSYYAKSGIQYKGSIKVIDGNMEVEKVIEEQDFEYTLLDNDNYYYRIGGMELINKTKFILAADHDNKTVSLAPRIPASRTLNLFDIAIFRKYMEQKKGNARVAQLGDEKVITIDHIDDPDIQGYSIYYSPDTYRIHKILIGMLRLTPLEDGGEDKDDEIKISKPDNGRKEEQSPNEEGIKEYYYYLEVRFNSIQTLTLNQKNFNPERKFIMISAGRIVLTPALTDYQLLNNIGM